MLQNDTDKFYVGISDDHSYMCFYSDLQCSSWLFWLHLWFYLLENQIHFNQCLVKKYLIPRQL